MQLTNFHFYNNKNYLHSKPVKGLQGYEVGYGFSFNGKEKDDETYGDGNAYDFGARIQDPRLGKWLSLDPLHAKYPGLSPYVYTANNPIILVDDDGKDFRLGISTDSKTGIKTITIETTVHLYGPDAESIANQLSKFESTGNVKLGNGETVNVQVTINYVVNKQLDAVTAGMNARMEQMPPPAEKFAALGVKSGDNIMYVDKNFPMAYNGQTIVGYNSGRVKRIDDVNTTIHESLHFLGFDERYAIIEGFGNVDNGFGKDYLSNSERRDEFSSVHLYDIAEFANRLGVKPGPIKEAIIDNTGGHNIFEHKPESDESVSKKKSSVQGAKTVVTPNSNTKDKSNNKQPTKKPNK